MAGNSRGLRGSRSGWCRRIEGGSATHQKIAPVLESLSCPGRQLEDSGGRTDASHVIESELSIEAGWTGKIEFGDDHRAGRVEQRGILQRFIFTFGGGEEGDAEVLTEIEGGWANEIADIFDEEQIEGAGVETADGTADHFSVEMAESAGGDLNDRGAVGAEALSIVVGGEIADDDGGPQAPGEPPNRLTKQLGFAGAGGGNEIDREDTESAEEAAVAFGLSIIGGEDRLINVDSPEMGVVQV
jgi:hypothetical protein